MRNVLLSILFVCAVVLGGLYLSRSHLKNSPVKNSVQASRDEDSSDTPDTDFEQRALKTLPYLDSAPIEESDKSKSGVTKFVREKANPGLNLITSSKHPEAYLLDMEGNTVHTWKPALDDPTAWQHADLLANGELLVVGKDKYVAKVSWDSKLIWVRPGRYHHDISQAPDGKIYSIRSVEKLVLSPDGKENFPVLTDEIDILSAKGALIATLPLYDLVADRLTSRVAKMYDAAKKQKVTAPRSRKIFEGKEIEQDTALDATHANSVVELDRKISDSCLKGDLLVSIRNAHVVGCINVNAGQFRWIWEGDKLDRQHHATVLANNDILLFDNRPRSHRSRVIEIDPRKNEIVWSTGKAPRFFSHSRGSAQRLPNGNTLVAESDYGRAFEITKEGEIVWEFYHPEIKYAPRRKEMRRDTFYRFIRFDENFVPKS